MTVEDVAEVQSENGFLDSLHDVLEGIAEVDLCRGIAWQAAVLVLRIVQILPADEVGVPNSLESFVVGIDKSIQDGARREGKRRMIVVEVSISALCIPVFHYFVEVLDLILAQGSIALEGQPGQGIPSRGDLSAHAIGVFDIGSQMLANITDSTGLHELVVVIHEVEVDASVPVVARVLIAELIIHQALSLWGRVGAIVGKVVALWLTMA